MEANGTTAYRLAGLDRTQEQQGLELVRQREEIARQKTAAAVLETKQKEIAQDVADLGVRMDRLARAFWAAAGTFMALTLTCVGIIVTVLSHG
jgi:hypothetical protein